MTIPSIEKEFPTRQRPPHREDRVPRTLTRFEKWAWSPITAFRLGLTLTYLVTIFFGVSAFIAGIPTFDILAPEGWTPIWASAMVVGAIVGACGSVSDRKIFQRIELGGAWSLFVTTGIYAACLLILAYGSGDVNRAAAGAGFVVLGVTPAVRMLWLMSQLGRRR
jgi:hypothetical protein